MLFGSLLATTPAATGSVTMPTVGRPIPTPQFRDYSVSDGLPSSNVFAISEDRRGVLWMATSSGLVRYDGTRFRVFRHDPRKPNSLASNYVSTVLIDHRQRVWVGGEGTGVALYRPATGDFRVWRHRDADPGSLAGDDIGALAEGTDGSIWVGMLSSGLDRLLPDGRIEHIGQGPARDGRLSSNIVLALKAGDKGDLWIGTLAGLDHRHADGRIDAVRFAGLDTPPRVWGIDGLPGHLRLDTNHGLYRLDADGVARRMLSGVMPATRVLSSVRDRHGDLWVGTLEGLYWIGANGRHRFFPPRPEAQDGLPGTPIWKLMFDHEGGLWLATRDGGVGYLGPHWRQFTVFRHHPGETEGLSIDRVLAMARDGRDLLVGGKKGRLDRLDPSTGKVRHQRLDMGQDAVTALANAGGGDLWIGHSTGVLFEHDGHVRKVGVKAFPGGINRIVADASGDAYVSAPVGEVYRIDRRTLSVHKIRTWNGHAPDSDVTALVMHHGRLWRSSMGGLARLDAARGQLVDVPGIAPGRIFNFAFDDTGLWLVREDAMEHYRLDHGKATLDRRIGVAQHWPEISVVAMRCDAAGRVWLASHTGLWRFDPASGRFRDYGSQDGLPSPEFSGGALVQMPDGTVYSGTNRGVMGWNPDTVYDHPQMPRLMLQRMTVQRHGERHDLPLDGGPVDLHWNDHELHVVVRALSYIDPKRNHYRFRMDGLDTGWVNTGTRGERDFTGLTHGQYVLHVQAAGPGRAWASLPGLHINVQRPPWNTPWAWVLYLMSMLGLLGMIVHLSRRRILQRHRIQLAEQARALAEQASAAKSNFLATLGHEIRTPMTGVLGMAELLLRSPLQERQRTYAETIRRSGTLLLRLVNEALDMARIEAGRLELDLAPLDPRALLDDVVQLETGVAQAKGLRLSSQVAAEVPCRLKGDALRVKQVLLNLVNNALKFTRSGSVDLDMAWVESGLQVSVRDTGPGVPQDVRARLFQRYEQADGPQRSSGSGLGLAICRELVTLMGGRIELAASGDRGSTFRVWLPLPVVTVEARRTDATPNDVHGARSVLLVEDDATVAEVIRGLLETSGHAVRHAANGLDGLVELEHGSFDVMLLDLDLPGINGFAIARMLREREGDGAQLPVIAITARSGGDEEEQARAAEMNGFLRKPISGEQLDAALQQVLGGHDAPGS